MKRLLMLALLLIGGARGSAMDLTLSEDRGFSYLIANEAIMDKIDVETFSAMLKGQAEKGEATAILLTSPGGALELATEIARVIIDASNELYARHGRANLIVINEECSSACAILMAAITQSRDAKSLEVYVTPDAEFGVHSPVDIVDGKAVPIADKKKREADIKKQLDTLRGFGVSSKWLDANKHFFERSKMKMFRAKDLCRDKAGIIPANSCLKKNEDVTVIVERYIKAIPGAPEPDFEEGVLAIPN